MHEFFFENLPTIWPIVSSTAAGLFCLYTFITQRPDKKFDRKNKEIELINNAYEKLPEKFDSIKEKLKELIATEKLNLAFGSNLNTSEILSCLNHNEPKMAIRLTNKYRSLITINGQSISTTGILNPENRKTINLFYIYMVISIIVGLIGFTYPAIFSKPGFSLSIYEDLFIRLINIIFLFFLTKEFFSIQDARKFFSPTEKNNLAAMSQSQ